MELFLLELQPTKLVVQPTILRIQPNIIKPQPTILKMHTTILHLHPHNSAAAVAANYLYAADQAFKVGSSGAVELEEGSLSI